MKHTPLILLLFFANYFVTAQNIQNNPKSNHGNKFEQLGTILPDANNFRAASGAPGSEYWQQRADYDIDAFLNEKKLLLEGNEQITYYNNSPDPLSYLWLQLDENEHSARTMHWPHGPKAVPVESCFGTRDSVVAYKVRTLSYQLSAH